MNKLKYLSEEANEVFMAMNYGMRLLVNRNDANKVKIVYDPKYYLHLRNEFREKDIKWTSFDELNQRGLITELTEETIRYAGGSKIGWREGELPGEEWHVYACTQ